MRSYRCLTLFNPLKYLGHYDYMDLGGRVTQEAKAETFIG
jgi:hypothetical protein